MSDTTTLSLIIGSYTAGREAVVPGQGLVFARFDPDPPTVGPAGWWHAPEASFSVLSPAGDRLYTVREEAEGQVTAFAVGEERLRHLSTVPTGGEFPCYLTVDPSGGFLLAANYGSGSVAVHAILPDGALGERTDLVTHVGSGPVTDRQEGPHAHMIVADPTGETLLAVDLGADSVYAYTLDIDSGRLVLRAANRMRPGSGPRHLAFNRSGDFAYLVNELDSTISVLSYDRGSGKMEEVAVHPTVAVGDTPNFPGGVVLSPDGRFVYVANRGDESITVFAVAEDGADLAPAGRWDCGGSWPRHLTLSPDGRTLFCANQRSSNVTVFQVDAASGALAATDTSLEVDQPAHVLVVG